MSTRPSDEAVRTAYAAYRKHLIENTAWGRPTSSKILASNNRVTSVDIKESDVLIGGSANRVLGTRLTVRRISALPLRRAKTLHDAATAERIAAATALGLEFWAAAPFPRSLWAIEPTIQMYLQVKIDGHNATARLADYPTGSVVEDGKVILVRSDRRVAVPLSAKLSDVVNPAVDVNLGWTGHRQLELACAS